MCGHVLGHMMDHVMLEGLLGHVGVGEDYVIWVANRVRHSIPFLRACCTCSY
jgi:hypothetical protein